LFARVVGLERFEGGTMSKAKIIMLLVVALTSSLMTLNPADAVENDDSVGVVDVWFGIWYLRDAESEETTSFYFGDPFDTPFMGDWDCDGIDTPGLHRKREGYVYLRNSNTEGPADISFYFGNPKDVALAGDFNADGCDTVSIYRPSQARVFIINELGTNDDGLGAADFDFYFGDVGDKAFTADFNNNGQDTVGLHRESTGFVYYRDTLTTGIANNEFFFGDPGDQIIAGRWNQNPNPGPDTVGIFRRNNGLFYLRFTNSQGNADSLFPYGYQNTRAVTGVFGALPGGDPRPTGSYEWKIVHYVVDGDTIDVEDLYSGVIERVRLIGIDTPEAGQCYFDNARQRLIELVLDKVVRLERDISDTDQYGRLLRYVRVSRSGYPLVNLTMVQEGYAYATPYPPDTLYADELQAAQDAAQAAGLGLWSDCVDPEPGCDPSYPTLCIPPPPPDLDCGDIPYRRFTVLPPDPHGFDGNGDGIGCET
jgi:endonuclease YncB( thermonuclease family)